MSYVVAGVSGNTGRVAAEALLAAKKPVRAIVRSADKGAALAARGAELAVADLGDAAALTRAFAGATGAYVLVPPNFAVSGFRDYQRATVAAITEAVRAARVPHVVLLSSVGADLPSGNGPIAGLFDAEKALGEIPGTVLTSLRAGYFMENLGSSLGMLEQGLLPSFFPADYGIEMVATRDIGRTAADLLLEGGKANQVVQLAGPKVTMNAAAAALSALLGKEIRVNEAPVEAMVGVLTSMGVPAEMAALYQEMTASIVAGRIHFSDAHRRIVSPTTLREVLGGLLGKGG